jgi:hypothetical protein
MNQLVDKCLLSWKGLTISCKPGIGCLRVAQRKDPPPLWEGGDFMPGKPETCPRQILFTPQEGPHQDALGILHERFGQLSDQPGHPSDAIRMAIFKIIRESRMTPYLSITSPPTQRKNDTKIIIQNKNGLAT